MTTRKIADLPKPHRGWHKPREKSVPCPHPEHNPPTWACAPCPPPTERRSGPVTVLSSRWESMESEADADIAEGRLVGPFLSPEELIKHLRNSKCRL